MANTYATMNIAFDARGCRKRAIIRLLIERFLFGAERAERWYVDRWTKFIPV